MEVTVPGLFTHLDDDKVISSHDYWKICEFIRLKSDDLDDEDFQGYAGPLAQFLLIQLLYIKDSGIDGKAVGEFTKAELLREVADCLFDAVLCEAGMHGGDARKLPDADDMN